MPCPARSYVNVCSKSQKKVYIDRICTAVGFAFVGSFCSISLVQDAGKVRNRVFLRKSWVGTQVLGKKPGFFSMSA